MRASSINSDRIMDPRRLLLRRYQMMALHFGLIVALIIVSTFEVRSAILLGIHCGSAVIFLAYVPAAAFLSWRDNRWGAKVSERRKGGRWTWDCASMEAGYLCLQLSTTLISGILCSITLSSAECFGRVSWALDEFAEIKERDVDDWCDGVVGATVLSWCQFLLDLIWLIWVLRCIGKYEVYVARRKAGTAPSATIEGSEEIEMGAQRRTTSISIQEPTPGMPRSTSSAFPLPIPESTASSSISPTPPNRTSTMATGVSTVSSMGDLTRSPLSHTLLTPVPRILTSLAENKHAQHQARLRRLDPRNRTRHVQRAPERSGNGDTGSDDSSDRTLAIRDIEAGENVPGSIEIPPPYDTRKVPAYPGT